MEKSEGCGYGHRGEKEQVVLRETHNLVGRNGVVRDRGMLTGSKRQATKPKQIQNPKLALWPVRKECCQASKQQGGGAGRMHSS